MHVYNTSACSLNTIHMCEEQNLVPPSKPEQVRITFEERHSGDWGGFKPKVVVEYDERNNYLMAIDIVYNRREADKNLGYNFRELKDKIQHELDSAQARKLNVSTVNAVAASRTPAQEILLMTQ